MPAAPDRPSGGMPTPTTTACTSERSCTPRKWLENCTDPGPTRRKHIPDRIRRHGLRPGAFALVVFVSIGCEAPSPESEPGARPAVPAPPASEAPGAALQPGSTIDAVQFNLAEAHAAFTRADYTRSANRIEDVERQLRNLAERADPRVRPELNTAAIAMGELAVAVRGGAIASVVHLDSALAAADYAMARYHLIEAIDGLGQLTGAAATRGASHHGPPDGRNPGTLLVKHPMP